MTPKLLTVIFLVLIGLAGAIFPGAIWKIRFWMIRDAEPSDAAIIVIRVVGILMAVFALLWLAA